MQLSFHYDLWGIVFEKRNIHFPHSITTHICRLWHYVWWEIVISAIDGFSLKGLLQATEFVVSCDDKYILIYDRRYNKDWRQLQNEGLHNLHSWSNMWLNYEDTVTWLEWLQTWNDNGIYWNLTDRNYSTDHALTVLRTSLFTIGHSLSVTDFTGRYLLAVSQRGRSPSSRFPNYHRPQLPASHCNSSQRINPCAYLSHSSLFDQSIHFYDPSLTLDPNLPCL
jgi:hypothetical protein